MAENETPTPRFYLMVGIPGSGKTTYARRHLEHALRISLDDLRFMLTGVDFDSRYESRVITIGHAALEAALGRAYAWRQDILLDATNVTRERRKQYLRLAERYGLPTVAVYVEVGLETALARDRARPHPVGDEVVNRYHSQLQPPTLDEGFAEVIYVPEEMDT
ncbi:MAG: AAA family ATPase [Chloroflexota bacterium]